MCVRGATPEISSFSSALCIANTPIPGIQKHLFWPMVSRGMCVRSATLKTLINFLHCPLQTHPSQVSKNTFSGPWNAEVCMCGAPLQKYPVLLLHCALQTHPSQVSKKPFFRPRYAEVCGYGGPPLNPRYPLARTVVSVALCAMDCASVVGSGFPGLPHHLARTQKGCRWVPEVDSGSDWDAGSDSEPDSGSSSFEASPCNN